ncbi:MAG: TonB-dependent receptor [Acidimicrobiia bacterium]|nr:TonB-dependent receptor [Acidimicrobiia bacterium]
MRPGFCSSWRVCRPRHASLFLCLAVLVGLLTARGAAAATLSGRAIDPDGRAIPNARVVVSGPLGAIADTRTSSTGDFELVNLPDGDYDVRILADGFHAPPTSVTLAGQERHAVSVQLHLSAVEETIVVSATHVPVARSEAPASVTVITASDLQARQVETVADALRDVPGLTVTRSGGRGSLTALFPRGGSSNYTLVLVDGVRTNAFGGAFDFAHVPVANVDRIEIVRGPQSALYGSEAIGAVVQIITRRGGAPSLAGQIEAGSLRTARATLAASGSRGRLSWGAGAERYSSDGNNGRTVDGVTVTNDDYRRTSASGTLAYRTDGGLDAGLAASIGTDERGFPGPWGADPIGAFTGVDSVSRGQNDNRRIGLHVASAWSRTLRQRVEVTYADLAGEFISPFGPSSSGTKRFDARVQEDVAVGRMIAMSAGTEFILEQGRSTYVTGPDGTLTPIDRRALGLFAEVRLNPSRRWQLTGGLRLEQLMRNALAPSPLALPPRPAFDAQTVRSLNPKVAATWLVSRPSATASTRLRASAGTGIRPPDVFEIGFTDNPNLQPERSRSFEVGVEQRFGDGTMLDGAWFVNRYDDLIVAIGRALGNASRWRTDNISNARARGLELSSRTRLRDGLEASVTYTWLSTAILSTDGLSGVAPAPFAVGDPLIRRPRHQAGFDLRYSARHVSVFAALNARSRMLDLEPNYGSFGGLFFAPGYAVVDLGAATRLGRGLELFGRVNNVANRRYEETLGYPALGRTVMVGVRVAAGS